MRGQDEYQFQMINFRKRKPQTRQNREPLMWGGKHATPPYPWGGKQERIFGPTERSMSIFLRRGRHLPPENQSLPSWNLPVHIQKKILTK